MSHPIHARSSITAAMGIKTLFAGLGLIALSACGGVTTSGGSTAPTGTTPPAASTTPAVDLANTTAGSSAVSVLLLDTGANSTGFAAGTYTHSTAQTNVAGNSYGTTRNTNRYVAQINGGGTNRIVALESPASALNGAGATYNGKANMEYVDTPSGNTFRGTLDAKITADFTGGTVDIDLTNPSGTFGGAAYAGGGRVDIDDLAISGARYSSGAGSSASLTGFAGATGLNSGAQTVDASGVFGGPNAEETGATAVITDGANGLAVLDLIGKQ